MMTEPINDNTISDLKAKLALVKSFNPCYGRKLNTKKFIWTVIDPKKCELIRDVKVIRVGIISIWLSDEIVNTMVNATFPSDTSILKQISHSAHLNAERFILQYTSKNQNLWIVGLHIIKAMEEFEKNHEVTEEFNMIIKNIAELLSDKVNSIENIKEYIPLITIVAINEYELRKRSGS